MRAKYLSVLVVVLCLSAPSIGAFESSEELEEIADSIYSFSIDKDQAYTLENVTLKKDIGSFTFVKGTFHLAKPVQGGVRMAVFTGQGTASIKPLRKMDQHCLNMAGKDHMGEKFHGEVTDQFSQLTIISMDNSIDEFAASLGNAHASEDTGEATTVLESRVQRTRDLDFPLGLQLLANVAGLSDGPTSISFKTDKNGWLEFLYDTRAPMEVTLVKIIDTGNTWRPEVLIRTHKMDDFDEAGNYVADYMADMKPWIDIERYDMNITIPDTASFEAEGTVTFTTLIDNLEIIPFNLVNNVGGLRSNDRTAKQLTLKSITSEEGETLPVLHRKHQVWVVPPEPLKIGRKYTLGFSVESEAVFQISSEHYFISSGAAWYPQHGYVGGQYLMDWTIKAKKPLFPTGSGKIVSESSSGGFNTAHLVFDRPVWLPFIIFGKYKKHTDVYERTADGSDVDLAIFYSPRTVFNFETPIGYQSVEVTVPPSKPKTILDEAKEIIKFYEDIYGPFPFEQLHVAQMAPGMGFGQGPAGFVQLTGEAFMSTAQIAAGDGGGRADFFHAFFAHEIAHQYWAHNIKWATDEDVWLSESFAEYTSGLYIMGLQGPKGFQGQLKEWRDMARIADPHGPVAWAQNMSGVNAGTWRTGLLYNKGPYVVHMLRMQIGHDNYVKAMKNLMEKYGHQQITTDVLRREFEEVVGYKLDYFFDQWYRGTGIPMFDYSTDVQESEDGNWVATIKLSQRDKENFKVVMMPVFFHFGKDKVVMKNRPVLKADDVYRIKLPEKPQKITLDDHNTLLADIVLQGSSSGY